MKKLFTQLALGSLLIACGACSSEEGTPEENQTGRVFVKLENVIKPSTKTRTMENPKTEADVTEFHNGFIIFGTPKEAIRKHYEIVSDPSEANKNDHIVLLDELLEGKTFEGIPGDVTNVAIVANVTEDELNPEDFHNGTIRFHNDVLNHVIQLRNQYADNMSHVALYDMKMLQGVTGGAMSAALELRPMCARLEIPKITPGPDVVEYQVDGIYLAGFYNQMYISQISNRDFWTGPDYDTQDPSLALRNFYTGYPYLAHTESDIRAVKETMTSGETTREVTAFYPSEEGKVWAFPFFGKYERRNDDQHYGLRLIVKVSHLKVYLLDDHGNRVPRDVTEYDRQQGIPEERAGIRYLNINGFVEDYHNTLAEPIQFYNGNVYTVQNFEITTQNLSDKIMPNDINVTLSVTVKPWIIKKVYPQI